ncbi:Uncharacterised protein [Acinetobacter baumannii]|nr:Uncharacterised protein [Acinetobacter baumannii]
MIFVGRLAPAVARRGQRRSHLHIDAEIVAVVEARANQQALHEGVVASAVQIPLIRPFIALAQ